MDHYTADSNPAILEYRERSVRVCTLLSVMFRSLSETLAEEKFESYVFDCGLEERFLAGLITQRHGFESRTRDYSAIV